MLTTAPSRIGHHLRCNTAHNIWKCITGRELNGIKLCTDVRTQIDVLGRDNSAAHSLPPPTHAMTPTPPILQAISKQPAHKGVIRLWSLSTNFSCTWQECIHLPCLSICLKNNWMWLTPDPWEKCCIRWSLASSFVVLLFAHTSAGPTVSISVTAACCSSNDTLTFLVWHAAAPPWNVPIIAAACWIPTDTLMFLFMYSSTWWLVPVVTVACCGSTDMLTFLVWHTAAQRPVPIIAAACWISYDMLIFLVTHTSARWLVPITIVVFHNLTGMLMFCPANKITILIQKWCRAIPWIYHFQISLKALYFPLKHTSLHSHPVQLLCWYTCWLLCWYTLLPITTTKKRLAD